VKFLFDHDVPDDMAYGLATLGHEVFRLRELIDPQTTDEEVLRFAGNNNYVLITCNRNDFLPAAQVIPHVGRIILIRRHACLRERVALFRLLDRAGEEGISGIPILLRTEIAMETI
jgi:predicted nuclease of predicted toxin-antitoxin system